MKPQFTLFRRGRIFYCQDSCTKQQTSLKTADIQQARILLHSKNEAFRQPQLNLQIARVYLTASDPQIAKRTWQTVMDEMLIGKTGPTLIRYARAMKATAFDPIRAVSILETQALHFIEILKEKPVSVNIFLRRVHNHALGMNYLPWPIIPKKRWPKIRFKDKRAVTSAEHASIIDSEHNPERKAFYQCCWHLGGSQTDIANLTAEDIDWNSRIVSFHRLKTKTASIIRIGEELEAIFKTLPKSGPLFPRHRLLTEAHRAREFSRRCARVGIKGITLHSYRYSWAERAKSVGYPERFAQEALGHQSKAIHRVYSKHAQVILPPLESYEKGGNPIPLPHAAFPLSS